MLIHVLPQNEAAVVAVRASKVLVRADLEVLLDFPLPDDFVTVLVGTSD